MRHPAVPVTILLALTLLVAPSGARQTRLRPPDVKYVPTPQSVVEAMLALARVTAADIVYDLGSGDGRIPITAAKKYGARGVGMPSATVVVAVFRQAGTNAVEVSKSVRGLLPVIQAELPGSMQLVPTYDRSVSIVHSINDVKATLLLAFGLAFVFGGTVVAFVRAAVVLGFLVLFGVIPVAWAVAYAQKTWSFLRIARRCKSGSRRFTGTVSAIRRGKT